MVGPIRDRRSPSASGGARRRTGVTADSTRIHPDHRLTQWAKDRVLVSTTAARGSSPANSRASGPTRAGGTQAGAELTGDTSGLLGGNRAESQSRRCAPRGAIPSERRATLRTAERLDRSSDGPGPGDLIVLGSWPVRLTLAAEAEQGTDPGYVPRRTGAERLRTEPLERIQPAARPSGSTSACPLQGAIRDQRSGSRLTLSSRAGRSAGRRRRRRDVEVLLVVRRAEQSRGLLDGGHRAGPIVIDPRRPGSRVDDEGDRVATVTLHSHRPAARAPRPPHPQHAAADGSPFLSSAVVGP
jgi:hypothetical protein